MPLFSFLPVPRDAVAALVQEHWGLTLAETPLKASQNTTFAATGGDGARFAVRATPDPEGAQLARIADELAFVHFLAAEARVPGVCGPVARRDMATAPPAPAAPAAPAAPPSSSPFALHARGLTLCVSAWAPGAPVDFLSYRWATDAALIRAHGAAFAAVHAGSRAFAAAHPAVAARMRRWTEVHEGIMAPAEAGLHPEDAAAAGDPAAFGILHGDLNVSNFHVVEGEGGVPTLAVFDWDQVQAGWFEYDLAQAVLTALMLAEAGSLPAGDPVPEARPAFLADELVAGYETVAGAGAVDRARLGRMLALRKDFYGRFCRAAVAEGSPPDMAWFIAYCDAWVNGPRRAGVGQSEAR
jgi:Ser/Thr protein kinase RdoA (MazF antagonist)